MSLLIDCEPDIDTDTGHYGYCPQCECNVRTARKDFGIGSYEYWGARGRHVDMRDVCPNCDGDVCDPQLEADEFQPEA